MKKLSLELFSGTASFSKVAREKGYNTITLDNDIRFNPDICIDFMSLPLSYFSHRFDILWASPPCDAFSVASIGHHWKGGKQAYIPKTDKCMRMISLIDRTIKFISHNKPIKWYIENPRGVLRKVIDPIFRKYGINDYRRVTVSYCQYGDTRMKPTDIWTNDFYWKPRKICKNGDSCHIRAIRGAKTGTQGIKGRINRAIIPRKLIREIIGKC